MICDRINGSVILAENIFVAVCLFTHRTTFGKHEFWLHLVCLNIIDLGVGLVTILLSCLRYSSASNLTHCSILWIIITILELTFVYNVLGICFYRLLFLVKSGKYRCGWKVRMTVLNCVVNFVIACAYSVVPYIIWVEKEQQIMECSTTQLFKSKRRTFSLYIGIGFFVPLLCTNVLYSILLFKLRLNLKRGHRYSIETINEHDKFQICKINSFETDRRISKNSSITKMPSEILLRKDSSQTQSPKKHRTPAVEVKTCLTLSNDTMAPDGKTNKFLVENMNDFNASETSSLQEVTNIPDPESGRRGDSNSTTQFGIRYSNIRSDINITIQSNGKLDSRKSETNERKQEHLHAFPTRNHTKNHFLVYGGERKDNQKQCMYLIGVIVCLINVTFFIPGPIILADVLDQSFKLSNMAMQLLLLIPRLNALLNPLVYTFQSREFRQALVENATKIFDRLRFCICINCVINIE